MATGQKVMLQPQGIDRSCVTTNPTILVYRGDDMSQGNAPKRRKKIERSNDQHRRESMGNWRTKHPRRPKRSKK